MKRIMVVVILMLFVVILNCPQLSIAQRVALWGVDAVVNGFWYDVRNKDTYGDGSTDDRDNINVASVAAAANSKVLFFPPDVYRVASNVTINAAVAFMEGASLSIDSGATVTFAGTFKAGLYQIFSGEGSVSFSIGVCNEVYPQWWGAVGDDSTNNADAFNAALGAAATIGTVYIPTGTYRVTTPINEWPAVAVWNRQDAGIIFRGAGHGDTVIKYMGTSGYAIEITPASQFTSSTVSGHTVENIHIQCANVTDIDTGGAILVNGANHTLNGVTVTYCDNGTAFAFISRDVSISEDGMTHDTDRDFTTTGAGASEKYAFKFTTGAVARLVHSVTLTLAKTGAPAGTLHFEVWTNSAGAPNAQTGGDSETVTLTDLSAAAGGAEVKTFFGETNSPPSLSASTDYWLVMVTTGYTYTDGATEVRLRVDAGDGDADGFATFTWGGAWATSDDGANFDVEIRFGQGINHRMNDCFTYGPTGRVGRGIRAEDGAIVIINGCFIAAQRGIYTKRCDALLASSVNLFTLGKLLECHGTGWINFGPGCWMEGSATDSEVTGRVKISFNGPVIGGGFYTIDGNTIWTNGGTEREPLMASYTPSVRPRYFYHRIITSQNHKWDVSGTHIDSVADADALGGSCHQLDAQSESVQFSVYPDGAAGSQHHYGQLPPGTYQVTIWAKDSNQVASDFRVQIQDYPSSWVNKTLTQYTLTANYNPYYAYIVVDEPLFTTSRHGNKVYMYKTSATVNTISISHLEIKYLGPDELYRTEAIMYNSLAGDADGDRESRALFMGRQSGSEISALASITVTHDGSSDDQKGKMEIGTNATNDLLSPTKAITIYSTQAVTFAESFTIGDDSDNDFSITFDGDTSDGVLNYDEDNAEFEFDQDVIIGDLTAENVLSAGVHWTSRTSAADNEWTGIVYGDGLFVAVAGDGANRVMTSPDGVNWTSRSASVNNSWRAVAYGNGLFVAVSGTGGADRVMTSPDGITWTTGVSASVQSWYSITYGNGVFVAVELTGTGSRVMSSTDGITWTSRTSAADNDWRGITYGDGLFVAVAITGTNNRVMTSPDGTTWTIRVSAADDDWFDVTYGNGLFVAVSVDGTVMTSADGITWTTRTAAEANAWRSVTYGDGLFVAVAASGIGNRVMTSLDGITWTIRTSAANIDCNSVAYGNGMFVAVSESGTGNRVMTSGKTEFNVIPTKNIYQGGMTITGALQGDPLNDQFSYMLASNVLQNAMTPPLILAWISPATTESDLSGNGNDATYNNFVAGDQDYKGLVWGLSFYTDNDEYLTVGDDAAFSWDDSGTNPVSVCVWVEVVATGSIQTIIAKYSVQTTDREWLIILTAAEKSQIEFYDESADVSCTNITDAALSAGWHFLVHTYDSTGGSSALSDTNSIWYVDGVAVDETQSNDGSYVAMEAGSTDVTIGGYNTGAAIANFFQGDMGIIWIEDVKLSALQVWSAYISTRGYYNE